MAKKKPSRAADHDPDKVVSADDVGRIHAAAERFCRLDPRRKKGEDPFRCVERVFARELRRAWKHAKKVKHPEGPRFAVRCFEAGTETELPAPGGRETKAAATKLAQEGVVENPRAICLVVPRIPGTGERGGRPAVVRGAEVPIETAVPDVSIPAAVEIPERAPEVPSSPVVQPAPLEKKAKKTYSFLRFDMKGGFGWSTRQYASDGNARSAFRAMTGPDEGYLVLAVDKPREGKAVILTCGACVDREKAPAQFVSAMQAAGLSWKDSVVVGDPTACAAASAREVEDAGGEAPAQPETPVPPAPEPPPGPSWEWASFSPAGVPKLFLRRAASREDALYDVEGMLTADGLAAVRSPEGTVTDVRRGASFDPATLDDEARALFAAWRVDLPAAVVQDEVATPGEAAEIVAAALVPAPSAPDAITTAAAAAPPVPLFVPKAGWEALGKAVNRLDPDQRAVAEWKPAPGKNLRILAGAGGGKTNTLTAWIARLVHDGADPSRIVVTTFTKRAAGELVERLRRLLPADAVEHMAVGTFDSLATRAAARLMRGRNHEVPGFSGLRSDRLWIAVLGGGWAPANLPKDVKDAAYREALVHGTDVHGMEIEFPGGPGIKAGTIHRGIEILRSRGFVSGSPEAEKALSAIGDDTMLVSRRLGRNLSVEEASRLAWAATARAKAQLGLHDFADLELRWLSDLRASRQPERLVFVDEAQDNSLLQLEIARALASTGSLVLIGDVRQAIFPWRGAFPGFFRDADSIIGAETLEIRSNYRSARAVVDAANAAARGRSWNPGADQIPQRPDAGRVVVQGFPGGGELEQAKWIAQDIEARLSRGETLSYEDGGAKKSRFAILTATNAEALPLQMALFRRKIPTAVAGGRFFASWPARAFEAYAKLATYDSLKGGPDWEAFALALSVPKRYLGEAFVREVRAVHHDDLAEAMRRAAPQARGRSGQANALAFAQEIADLRTRPWTEVPARIGEILGPAFTDVVGESDEDEAADSSPILNPTLAAIIEMAALFGSFTAFIDFAKRSEAATTRVNTDDAEPPADRVLISTLYKAKGLEWPVVYLLASQGKLPGFAFPEIVDTDRAGTAERLFYVGVSRARDELVACWWSTGEPPRVRGGPSPFLQWIAATPAAAPSPAAPPPPPVPPEHAPASATTDPPVPQAAGDRIVTPHGEEPVVYAIVDSDAVIPSHDPTTFRASPGYPPAAQERDYSVDKPEQDKVARGGRNLNPALVLSDTQAVSDGPPIVSVDLRVLGGNGRTMMIRRAYAEAGAGALRYREALRPWVSRLGLSPDAMRGLARPMLVRVVDLVAATASERDLARASRRYNESLTLSLPESRKAVSEARTLPDAFVQAVGEILSKHDISLRDLLREHPRVMLNLLVEHGIVHAGNRPEWTDDGRLTSGKKIHLENMLAAIVLGTAERMEKTAPSLLEKIHRIVPAVVRIRAGAPDVDILGAVRQVVDFWNGAAAGAQNADERRMRLREGDLLRATSPEVQAVAAAFEELGPRTLQRRFDLLADRLVAEHGAQTSLVPARPVGAILKLLLVPSSEEEAERLLAAEKARAVQEPRLLGLPGRVFRRRR